MSSKAIMTIFWFAYPYHYKIAVNAGMGKTWWPSMYIFKIPNAKA